MFHADQQRRERLDVHRRVRIEIVPVLVKPIPERADREDAEVGVDGEEIDHVAHFAENDRAQRHQDDQTEDERHPAHLEEIRLLDRLHPDVVIEIVDLVEVLAVQSAALDFVAVDVEIESVGILRRDQMHFPEREKDRRRDRDRGGEQEQARPEIERLVQKTELAPEQVRNLFGPCRSRRTRGWRNSLQPRCDRDYRSRGVAPGRCVTAPARLRRRSSPPDSPAFPDAAPSRSSCSRTETRPASSA